MAAFQQAVVASFNELPALSDVGVLGLCKEHLNMFMQTP